MFYIYVLESGKNNDLYIGYSTNLKKRLEAHNKKGWNQQKLIHYGDWFIMKLIKIREMQLDEKNS